MAGSINLHPLRMILLRLRLRRGFTLLETVLFFGILSIIAGTIIAVYISTQEARVRQHAIAELEQNGTQLVEMLSRQIRRAEKILDPPKGETGSILALQMALNTEFPTIIAEVGSGALQFVQKTATSSLLPIRLKISNTVFRNVADDNVVFSFDLGTVIHTIPPAPYSRRYNGTVTLFPDHESESGGCGSCAPPSCNAGIYVWNHCHLDMCTESTVTMPC